MLTLSLHSDMHLELQDPPGGWLHNATDIVVLAGDIAHINEIAFSLKELSKKWPETHIVFVAGNHEFYRMDDILTEERRLKEKLKGLDRVHFLQCDAVNIKGIRFLGCTGWPQMTVLGAEHQEAAMNRAGDSIRDFSLIHFNGQAFTPEDCVTLGNAHYEWLENELARSAQVPTVVVTHFAPALEFGNQNFPINELAAYFCANYGGLLQTYQPDYWLFGHTHYNVNTLSGKTHVISNQKGYGRECVDTYDPFFELSIPHGGQTHEP